MMTRLLQLPGRTTFVRAFLHLGLAGTFLSGVRAETLTWKGNGFNLSTAANWEEGTAPTATSDLVITRNGTTSGGNGTSNYLMGGNLTIHSLTFNNAASFINPSNGARVISTNSSTNNANYVLSFTTPGIDIITLSDNANASFRAASLGSNSSATPLPALTLDLNYSGQANLNIKDTSILLVSAGSQNAPEARIAGTGGLVKIGGGSVTLSGNHTYTGGFTLQEGTSWA